MQNLAGKTAIITGGASGIGLGIARALLEAGMNVAIGDVQADALQAAARALADELEKGLETAEEVDETAQASRYNRRWRDDEPVPPEVRKKFNQVSNACRACHATFRGPEW